MIRLLFAITFSIVFLQNPIFAQYDFNINNIPDSLLRKANSVVRHSITDLDIYEDKLTYKYDYAITALNKKHEGKLSFAEHFRKNESKVKDVKIAIYDAEGQLIKKVKKKELKEYGLQYIEFADDQRSMLYQHKSPIFPVTIHVTYRHEIESPYYLESWFPTVAFKQSVEFASIRIKDHFGDSFDYQVHQLPEPLRNTSEFYIESVQQMAMTKEGNMPDKWECLPRLELSLKRLKYFEHFGYIKDWKEFGSWIYNKMFLPKQDMNYSQLKAETDHLMSGQDSDLTKSRKLYEYIQNTTRYVLISLQDGGWSPLPVSIVHNKKYGDCKALSFYYNSLCKAHGIDATLALIYAGYEKRSAQKDFYSSSQFNHVITQLKIDGETYWVDCTSKANPFNFIGKFNDDRHVLLINGNAGTITNTPEYKNTRKTQTQMTFTGDGILLADIDIQTEGIGISSKLKSLPNMTDQEMASYQKESLKKYDAPMIKSYVNSFDTTNLNFKEQFKIECKNAGERLGDHIKIKLDRNELEVPKLKRDNNRVWPIQFLRNRAFTATTVLNHELNMVPVLDEDVVLDSEFGTYTFSSEASAGQVVINRTLKIYKASYEPSQYKAIKSFFDKIRTVEKRSIIISAKS